MVPLTALWLPILLSAVIVFVASSLIHMFLGYHKTDYSEVPRQDDVQNALRPFAIPPGDYMLPRAGGMEAMKSPEFKEKLNKGPVAVLTVFPNGQFQMGSTMVQWFVYVIVVAIFAAYLASHTVKAGDPYLEVFRIVGATAFCGFSLALWQDSIWYKKKWSTTFKNTFDGLVYALLMAGTFGWLWPK